MSDPAVPIDAALARRLVAAQFPRWAGLPVRAVEPGGVDNRTFRLGDALKLRLPSAAGYAAQPAKEHRWLPALAPHLPVPIPSPAALGAPGEGCPWAWSAQTWLEGAPAASPLPGDAVGLARDVAAFLLALQAAPGEGGPPAGAHSFHRGGALAVYDRETRQALAALGGAVDRAAAARLWDEALAATWEGPPVWAHGDVAPGNLLTAQGRLVGVIDFGVCAVGDPACDLAIAWTTFAGAARDAFRAGVAADDGAWARGRGWALWKALITLADPAAGPARRAAERRTLAALGVLR